MTEQTATEATELDKSRRYLRPVEALQLGDAAQVVHLSVYWWEPRLEEWVTGQALCGDSAEEGALPEGTEVTCSGCMEWRPQYERMLAPEYRSEDEDPKMLRARIARVRNLHQQYRFAGDDNIDYCAHCNQLSGGWIPWPCPTFQALNGEQEDPR